MADHLKSTRGAIVVGDEEFGVHAVGTSAYQGPIESLVGGKTPMGYGVDPGHECALFPAYSPTRATSMTKMRSA
jgi:hypothetical protein